MIKRDSLGFILDDTGDGGDSANRAGVLATCGSSEHLFSYITADGLCVRHPTQVPWNNPWNFTRDQLIPFVAGLSKQGRYDLVRMIFWKHAKRAFFCQNFERDYAGSAKYPWPHTYIDDKGIRQSSLFDFADPLLPGDVWFLICAGRMFWAYWFGLLGLPAFCISLWVFCRFNEGDDEGQIISAAACQGRWALRLYRRWRPDYAAKLKAYWADRRNQVEIGLALTWLVDAA